MAKIAIDCDGVLANFIKAFTEEANKIWPGRFKPDYWQSHSQWNFPPELLSSKETNQVWERIKATPNWWMRLDAHADSVGALAIFFWTHRYNDVYIVTSRVETVGASIAFQTDTWIRACGVQPCHNHLGIVGIPNSDNKAMFYRISGMEFSIDDKSETVEMCDAELDPKKHKAFLLDRPWNQDAKVKNRVKTVEEYLKRIVS